MTEKIKKEFKLTTLAIKNKTSVFVLTLLIAVFGVISYITLPKENFPEVSLPTIYVSTIHPGNSPKDIENLITRELEKEINTLSDVDKISSVSVQDYSIIVVEFHSEVDVDKALNDVKDAVDKAKKELPSDLKEDPNVFKFDISENMPVLNVNFTGKRYTLDQLNEFAEYIEEEVEKLQEVLKAEILGVDEKEVAIRLDPYKMDARNVTFNDIEQAISAENITFSGGDIIADQIRRNIRIVGEYEDPESMKEIVVKQEKGDIIYLKDIATVHFTYKDKQNYARLDNRPVVKLDIMKKSGRNLIIATEKIIKVIEKAKKEYLPNDLTITLTNDQSKITKEAVNNLGNNIISGVILVVIVLLFFLGTRNALFVGMAIPLSMFTSLTILSFLGITINTMVLFSLIMALGMLVDNGIVLVENVYRLLEEGKSLVTATKEGVGEVALPIISSTATTLAAFIPLAVWPGIMGEFMLYLPLTLIITLSSSLFVALIINPVFIVTYMKIEQNLPPKGKKIMKSTFIYLIFIAVFALFKLTVLSNLLLLFALLIPLNIYVFIPLSKKFQSNFLPVLENVYQKTLKQALHNPLKYFFGTVLSLVLSILLFNTFTPNLLFFPDIEPRYINAFIKFPIGTDIEKTNEYTKQVEARMLEIIVPYQKIVEAVVSNVGQGASDPNDINATGESGTPHKSRITINFVENQHRGKLKTSEILKEIRKNIPVKPGVIVTIDKDANGPPVGKPINIEITGEDLTILQEIGEKLKKQLKEKKIQGIENLKNDMETGKPELMINIDREKARRFGLSTLSIANEIRTAVFGKEISKYKEGEDNYEINIRFDDKFRYDIDILMNKNITFRNKNKGELISVPISAVASPQYTTGYGSIRRINQKRVITLSSNVLEGYNATQINNQLREAVKELKIPKGYFISFTGEQEKQAEEMDFLSKALLIAVFMIFLIIVTQFNQITAPFIIMTTVLFSTIGVFLGLIIFNMDFIVIMTMIGIISLAGVVVNNAIVLIDFINLTIRRRTLELQTAKLPYHELLHSIAIAGRTRLRPVILTAITTILGLIPLAVGLNIDFISLFANYIPNAYIGGDNVAFWGPMSWTIIFGLSVSTFLTLVIVPVMYLLSYKIIQLFNKKTQEDL